MSKSDETRIKEAEAMFRAFNQPGTVTRMLTELYGRDATGAEAAQEMSEHPAFEAAYKDFSNSHYTLLQSLSPSFLH